MPTINKKIMMQIKETFKDLKNPVKLVVLLRNSSVYTVKKTEI